VDPTWVERVIPLSQNSASSLNLESDLSPSALDQRDWHLQQSCTLPIQASKLTLSDLGARPVGLNVERERLPDWLAAQHDRDHAERIAAHTLR
jgi:hypothetical protein